MLMYRSMFQCGYWHIPVLVDPSPSPAAIRLSKCHGVERKERNAADSNKVVSLSEAKVEPNQVTWMRQWMSLKNLCFLKRQGSNKWILLAEDYYDFMAKKESEMQSLEINRIIEPSTTFNCIPISLHHAFYSHRPMVIIVLCEYVTPQKLFGGALNFTVNNQYTLLRHA